MRGMAIEQASIHTISPNLGESEYLRVARWPLCRLEELNLAAGNVKQSQMNAEKCSSGQERFAGNQFLVQKLLSTALAGRLFTQFIPKISCVSLFLPWLRDSQILH